jgi:predicted metal-dependent hydrolase
VNATPTVDTLTIEGLAFELRRSDRRKTLGITVDRDSSLVISAPADCPLDLIEKTARKKLAQKRLLRHPATETEFVTGEGFHYLGRNYRLLLLDPEDDAVPALRLHQGRFQLRKDELHRADEHFALWYAQRAQAWIERRCELFAQRIGVAPGAVRVMDLGHRWGSCSPTGNVNFNWRTICLPPRIVEYVVVHELVHLGEHHHGPEFWTRLARAMPDYAHRKRWLAENSVRYVPVLRVDKNRFLHEEHS